MIEQSAHGQSSERRDANRISIALVRREMMNLALTGKNGRALPKIVGVISEETGLTTTYEEQGFALCYEIVGAHNVKVEKIKLGNLVKASEDELRDKLDSAISETTSPANPVVIKYQPTEDYQRMVAQVLGQDGNLRGTISTWRPLFTRNPFTESDIASVLRAGSVAIAFERTLFDASVVAKNRVRFRDAKQCKVIIDQKRLETKMPEIPGSLLRAVQALDGLGYREFESNQWAKLTSPDIGDFDVKATLDALLKNNGSPINAARELGVHRNTVLFRLNRISTVCGINVNDPEHRLFLNLLLCQNSDAQ